MRLEPLVRKGLFRAFERVVSDERFRSQIRESVIERDELTRGVACRCLWFDSVERFEVSAPYSPDPLPAEIRQMVGEHRIGQPFVCEVEDVELVGRDGVAVTQAGDYVLEESLGSIGRLVKSLVRTTIDGHVPRRKSGAGDPDLETAVSLVGPWSQGYYHWFSDYLLRLEGLEHYVGETGIEPTLLVPPDPPAWMEDSLELAGFGDYEWLEWSGSRATVGTLVVPSLRRETAFTAPEKGYVFSPRAYRWLGDRIRSNVDAAGGGNRIFISREKAEERHVVNQSAVMDSLDERGFEDYLLEDMSFVEQVRLFAGAETIVAPTGAGLTNMIYADDPTLVTLFGSEVNACYPVLADGLGFDAAIMSCEPVGLDMRADPETLVEILDRA